MSPNDPSLRSFIEVDAESHFPIQNLPFGIVSHGGRLPRAAVAIGRHVLDLAELAEAGRLREPRPGVFSSPSLNEFARLGRAAVSAVRGAISELLRHDNPALRDDAALRARVLVPLDRVQVHLPVAVGGFADFMLSREHVLNCAEVLGARDGQIWPHWMHLPIGYNSRASSVVVSGTPVKRPWGQWRAAGAEVPQHLPTRKLDFELEAALVIGQGNELGEPVRVEDADACGFGVVLLNDWSTRDIQAWESQPLGPFVSKSHRTSISPWVVTLDALEPFRVQGPDQVPPPLAYLRNAGRRSYDIELRASIRPEGADAASVVCRTNMKALYWSFAQQVAHQTSAGCNLQAGDLLGTGTVSGRGAGSLGCLYEATRDGRESIVLEHGGTRTYLEDGDEVIFSGWAQGHGYRVGFGECHGQVVAADRAFGVKS